MAAVTCCTHPKCKRQYLHLFVAVDAHANPNIHLYDCPHHRAHRCIVTRPLCLSQVPNQRRCVTCNRTNVLIQNQRCSECLVSCDRCGIGNAPGPPHRCSACQATLCRSCRDQLVEDGVRDPLYCTSCHQHADCVCEQTPCVHTHRDAIKSYLSSLIETTDLVTFVTDFVIAKNTSTHE